MSDNSRENQGRYSLRDLPRHDYRGQLRGLHIFRESYTSVDTEDCTEVEESLITGVSDPMEQLAAALASLAKLQEEQQRRWEEAQRQAEERRQEEERRREEAQRQAEERRQEEERRREEAQRQAEERRREEERQREEQAEERCREEERQRERHYEEIQAMQEQHMQQIEIMKGVLAEREGNSPHLKISPYQETEDIQDFIEAFEVARLELFVLILEPLLIMMESRKLFWSIITSTQRGVEESSGVMFGQEIKTQLIG
uniref:Uncharacterized protein n=1 Tax=Amphimedon queenslandica TaxID=400682 RepID=A0A1X7T475_AMPQE